VNIEPVNVIQVSIGVYDTMTENLSGSATVKEYEIVAPLNKV